MRRIVIFALSLMLCCILLTLAIGAQTQTESKTVTLLEGEKSTEIAAGETLPAAKAVDGKVFVGWLAEKTDTLKAAFLPAGAVAPVDGHESYTALYVGMSVRKGCELRLNEQSEGLRFLTDIDAAELQTLRTHAKVSYGTIIAPRDYVTKAGNVLTPEALAAVGLTKYLDIPTTGAYEESEELYTIAGSVANIRPENRTLLYYAAAYLVVTYTDGTTSRVYCSYQSKGINRLYAHVETAFGDRTAEKDQTHTFETEHGYSPYTTSERAFMETVLDSVISLSNKYDTATKKVVAVVRPEIEAYQAPFTAVYYDDSDGNAIKDTFILTCDGETYNFSRDFSCLILGGSVAPMSLATIEDDGKRLIIPYSSSTGNH